MFVRTPCTHVDASGASASARVRRVEPSSVEIQTDPGKLQIILGNLITNAIKYARKGSIVVTVRDRPD
jgi:signal transduction histidine kinase